MVTSRGMGTISVVHFCLDPGEGVEGSVFMNTR